MRKIAGRFSRRYSPALWVYRQTLCKLGSKAKGKPNGTARQLYRFIKEDPGFIGGRSLTRCLVVKTKMPEIAIIGTMKAKKNGARPASATEFESWRSDNQACSRQENVIETHRRLLRYSDQRCPYGITYSVEKVKVR